MTNFLIPLLLAIGAAASATAVDVEQVTIASEGVRRLRSRAVERALAPDRRQVEPDRALTPNRGGRCDTTVYYRHVVDADHDHRA